MTNHGGVVSECDKTFIINGIAVHLNGMKHFCPKCKTVVSAIASVIYAELSGDFPLGDSRQPTYKSLRPFDLVS